jgi:hypothetical protein
MPGPWGVQPGSYYATSAQGREQGAGWNFLADPYKEKSLKLQEEGQTFGQDLASAKLGMQRDLYGKLSGMLGQYGAVGGTPGPKPDINRGPLYTQQQIDQQTNAGVAGNDARYQTLMRQLAGSGAARGFGAQSPALQSQMNALGIANIGENARTIRETPMQYVQANADQRYRTDALAQQQYAQGEDEDIRRRQTQVQSLNALMSQLSGLV